MVEEGVEGQEENVFLVLVFIGVLFVLSLIFEKTIFPFLDKRKGKTEVIVEPEI